MPRYHINRRYGYHSSRLNCARYVVWRQNGVIVTKNKDYKNNTSVALLMLIPRPPPLCPPRSAPASYIGMRGAYGQTTTARHTYHEYPRSRHLPCTFRDITSYIWAMYIKVSSETIVLYIYGGAALNHADHLPPVLANVVFPLREKNVINEYYQSVPKFTDRLDSMLVYKRL